MILYYECNSMLLYSVLESATQNVCFVLLSSKVVCVKNDAKDSMVIRYCGTYA